jgi:competence protein ComEC
LWPPKSLAGIELGNPSSIAVELEPVGDCASGCLSSLFLGDLGEASQTRLLAAHPLGEVDIVKVAHHGSADQDAELYERLHAVVGLVCVGAGNGYGHPARSLLDILESVGTTALRTDRNGLVLVAPGSQPGTVRVWTSR